MSVEKETHDKNDKKKPQERVKFEDLKLIKPILKVVSELEFTSATPVQAMSIPAIISGKDVMVSSITGSGKTAAFLIPVLQRYYNAASTNYSRVLILTPTR
jgi:superfamily II DNA/RNA helicase